MLIFSLNPKRLPSRKRWPNLSIRPWPLTSLQRRRRTSSFSKLTTCALARRLKSFQVLIFSTIVSKWTVLISPKKYDMMPDRTDSCLFYRCLELLRTAKAAGMIRYGMYRVAHQHINGWLGKNNRTPLPHCVVEHIKALAPDPKGKYVGFRASKEEK